MSSNLDFVTTDIADLGCHTGVTFSIDLLVTQRCTGLPDNLTGYTARLLVYNVVETVVIASVTGTIASPTTGLVVFTIAASATALLPIGLYSHVIELTIGTTVYRIAQGDFEVSA